VTLGSLLRAGPELRRVAHSVITVKQLHAVGTTHFSELLGWAAHYMPGTAAWCALAGEFRWFITACCLRAAIVALAAQVRPGTLTI